MASDYPQRPAYCEQDDCTRQPARNTVSWGWVCTRCYGYLSTGTEPPPTPAPSSTNAPQHLESLRAVYLSLGIPEKHLIGDLQYAKSLAVEVVARLRGYEAEAGTAERATAETRRIRAELASALGVRDEFPVNDLLAITRRMRETISGKKAAIIRAEALFDLRGR